MIGLLVSFACLQCGREAGKPLEVPDLDHVPRRLGPCEACGGNVLASGTTTLYKYHRPYEVKPEELRPRLGRPRKSVIEARKALS